MSLTSADVKKILDVPLSTIHATIPDLGTDPVLSVQNTIQADFAQGLQLIQQSPLQQTIGKNLSALKLHGPIKLSLGLAIPLNHPADAKVTGNTTIANSILNLPDWNLTLDQLTGAFTFTEDSITASHLTGQLLGHPVTLDLATQNSSNKTRYVAADLQGIIDTAHLKSWLDLPVEEMLQGATNYRAQLMLPSHDSSDPAQIVVQSDLQGMAVNLPGDYGKKATDAADMNLRFIVKQNQPLKAKLAYNKLFSVAMMLSRSKQKFKLLNANLRLGAGDADWQTQSGIIVTGNIERLDWNKIQPYISSFADKTKLNAKNQGTFSLDPDSFRGLDIRTNLINFVGFNLNNLHIELSKTANNYVIELNNPDMAGQIILPRAGIQQGIQAKFARLKLPSQNVASAPKALDPRDLPPIIFEGDDVRYGDMSLGHATLNLVRAADGLAVKQFNLDSPTYQLRAVGSWSNVRSRLQGTIVTSNVSQFLQSFGFSSSNLIGTTGNVDFDLNWADGLFRPSVAGLAGSVSLKLGEGRIINLSNTTDAKMGLGRLLNIFSLQSLPHRLSLNFKDVSQKGYDFYTMSGDYILRNGNAVTQNTRLNGSIARIEISGRIGLAAKDLDIKLSVTPYVTSSLPVVAAIATANPVAGIATWVVDKMVSPAVSQLTTYNYLITGSWANPSWNQMGTQKIGKPANTAPVTDQPSGKSQILDR